MSASLLVVHSSRQPAHLLRTRASGALGTVEKRRRTARRAGPVASLSSATVSDPLSLGYGRSGESPWLWLVIVGGGIALYALARIGGWQQPRRWSDVGDALLLAGSPWW